MDLQLEEKGVWDEHVELNHQPGVGFLLHPLPQAMVSVNAHPIREPALLRSGDIIDLGAARLQFWLARTSQRSLAWREWATWIFLAVICLAQVALIYWLQGR